MKIEFRKTRPIFYLLIIIFAWFVTRVYPDTTFQDFIRTYPLLFSMALLILLLAAYLFQARETIEISNGFFIINSKKVKSKIRISAIVDIHHSFERLAIETQNTEIVVDISQFSSKMIKKLLEMKEIANLIQAGAQGRAADA